MHSKFLFTALVSKGHTYPTQEYTAVLTKYRHANDPIKSRTALTNAYHIFLPVNKIEIKRTKEGKFITIR